MARKVAKFGQGYISSQNPPIKRENLNAKQKRDPSLHGLHTQLTRKRQEHVVKIVS